MNFAEIWESIKKNWMVSALCTGLVGLLLLLFPGSALLSVTYCLGGFSIALGVIRTVRYFQLNHSYPYLFQSDLVVGLLTLGLGLFMVTSPLAVMSILPTLFGILLIGCGIGNIMRTVDAKKNGFQQWILLLVLAILTIGLGWLLLSNPFDALETMVAVAGGCMVYESLVDLGTTFVISKNIKDLKHLKQQFVKEAEKTEAAEQAAEVQEAQEDKE